MKTIVSVRDLDEEVLEPYRVIKDLSLMAGRHEYYDEVVQY